MDTSRTLSSPEPSDSSEQSASQASLSGKGEDASDCRLSPSEKAASKDPVDPIKWFGMFIPQAFRDAQSSFKAVISEVPSLASLAAEMQHVAAKIERLRAELKAHEQM